MGIRFSVNEEFFGTWNPEMAYTLGYWYADGNLEYSAKIRGHYIRVVSTDRDRIELFKELLKSEHSIIKEQPPGNAKKRYILRIGNRSLFEGLSRIGMTPSKSLTMQFPAVPKQYLSHFIRGYFDGDGCVFLEKRKGVKQELVIKKLHTIFTSGSAEFLQSLNTLLSENLGTQMVPSSKNGKRSYQLRYNTTDSIKIFRFLYKGVIYPLYLARKYGIFAEYFKLRPIKVDASIGRILKTNGLVAK